MVFAFPALIGIIDTQASGRLFSSLKRHIYYLNNVPCLLSRLIKHQRNVQRNRELLRKHTNRFELLLQSIRTSLSDDDAICTPSQTEIVVDWDSQHLMGEANASASEIGHKERSTYALSDTENYNRILLGIKSKIVKAIVKRNSDTSAE